MILISSKLSGTYNGAVLAKKKCADMKRYISWIPAGILILAASGGVCREVKRRRQSAEEIAGILEEVKNRTYLTGVPSTLLYLKKGGRIPGSCSSGKCNGNQAGTAAPEWRIEGYSKARGMKAAKSGMQAF